MEVNNNETNDKIKWGENELVTETLDATPRLVSDLDFTSRTVEFGNTGFDVRFNVGSNAFDFMPEGHKNPVKDAGARYSSFLGAGLLELHKLLNDDEKMKSFGLHQVDTSKMSAETNDYLIYALKNVFSRSATEGIIRTDYEKHIVEVDLDAFKNLKSDNPMMIFLEKTAERARRNTVTYQKRTI